MDAGDDRNAESRVVLVCSRKTKDSRKRYQRNRYERTLIFSLDYELQIPPDVLSQELALRHVLEDGKLNMCLRNLVDLREFQRKRRDAVGLADERPSVSI